jgi:hypothetical protein
MVSVGQPQQQGSSPDDAPVPEAGRGRHAAPPEGVHPHRFRRRRRWPVIAAVAALAVLVVPPPGPSSAVVLADVNDAALPMGLTSPSTIAYLSAGAPAGSIVLAGLPTQTGDQQPVAPTVISGLAANGIPNVALNAYRVAAARMGTASPSCGIDWSLLAGIGRVETNHARFRGAALNPDGTSTPRIMGPPLDGVQFAFIRDTDGGTWDGDGTFDRAVGPMQFIPATWRAYGIDGNGDGVSDPFNINDAALGAAHYLCVAGGNLRTDAGLRRAVMAYNHSDSYVNEVLALARAYASGIPVSDIPLVGNTSGGVPAPRAYGGSGHYGGPAAPGPAIGASDTTPSPPDQTVGASPQAVGQSGGGSAGSGAPPAEGTSGGGTGGSGSQPPTGSDSGGTSTAATSDSGSGDGGSTPTAPALPAPIPAPVPAPAPAPAPVPIPAPAPPPPPAPIPGVTCTTLDPVTGLKLLPALPLCP